MKDKFPKPRDMKAKLPLPSNKLYKGYGPPKAVLAKLQPTAKDLGERHAIRKNLEAHNARERLAAELDALHGAGMPIHAGLVEHRIDHLRRTLKFDANKNAGSAFHPL